MRKTFLFLPVVGIFLVLGAIFLIHSLVTSPQKADKPPGSVSLDATSTVTSKPGVPASPSQPIDQGGLHVAPGFQLEVWADHLSAPRDMSISPAGTLVVSEPNAGKVEAIRITDKHKTTLLTGLKRPHGVLFHEGKLFVAEEEQVSRYSWDEAAQKAVLEKVLFALPKGGLHNTRSLAFNQSGQLFVTIGSTCNVCNEKDNRLAAVLVSDADGKTPELFSSGLRNSPFLVLNTQTNQIWATEMGRDFLGNDTPPDEINILESGKNYGWPYCYGDRVTDSSQKPPNDHFCEGTTPPIYQVHAHSAPLGLQFIHSSQFPSDWQGDLLVAYHGSWNSTVPVGYKVVRLKVAGNRITGEEDFITGFIEGINVKARPVDLEFDAQGTLYLSDDKVGKIYKISKL